MRLWTVAEKPALLLPVEEHSCVATDSGPGLQSLY